MVGHRERMGYGKSIQGSAGFSQSCSRLGNDAFISTVQENRQGKDDWNIPLKQKRPVFLSLAKIVLRTTGRSASIIAAYEAGTYNQREVSEYFDLHLSTVGVIVRKHGDS